MSRIHESQEGGDRRGMLGLSRALVMASDDSKKRQELSLQMLHTEGRTEVEHWHPYGFFSVPLPPTEGGDQAAAIVAFIGGSRDHAVALGVSDKRHRPKGGQPGEVGLHDDQGQVVVLRRGGVEVTVPAGKTVTVTAGNAKFKIENGKIMAEVQTTRVFVRHQRIDLGKLDAPFKVSTEGGLSQVVYAVIDPP